MKIYEKGDQFWFFCPACDRPHAFTERWTFNHSVMMPTVRSSVRVTMGEGMPWFNCHSQITNGKIFYYTDCHHDMKGQTVDIPTFPEAYK